MCKMVKVVFTLHWVNMINSTKLIFAFFLYTADHKEENWPPLWHHPN